MDSIFKLKYHELLLITSLVFSGGALIKLSGHYFRLDIFFFVLFLMISSFYSKGTRVDKTVFCYPLGLLFIVIVSTLFNISNLKSSPHQLTHDLLSYILIMSMVFMIIKSSVRLTEVLCYFAIMFLLVGFAGSFFNFCYTHYLILDDPWSTLTHTNRFSFLSYTANQIALVILVTPFIVLHAYKQHIIPNKVFTIVLFMTALYLGYITRSRALYLAWVVSGVVFVYLSLWRKISTSFGKILILICFMFLFCGLAFYLYQLYALTPSLENTHRWDLLKAALKVLGNNPIWGLGAGAHVRLPDNPTAYIETHNTYLDLMTQAGFVGLTMYLFILFGVFEKIKKNTLLVSLLISLSTFTLFHLMIRHPIYWIMMIWLYSEAGKNRFLLQTKPVINQNVGVYRRSHLVK